MMKLLARSMGLFLFCVLGASLVAQANNGGLQGGSEPFKPVATVHALMEGQDMHFTAITDALKDESIRRRDRKIEIAAELLAELANVNMRNRPDAPDYVGWARDVRDRSLEMAKLASEKRNVDFAGIQKIRDSIDTTCNSCHDKYQ